MTTAARLVSKLCAGLICVASSSASALDVRPFVVGGMEFSRDTDDFHVDTFSAGAGVQAGGRNPIDRIGFRRSTYDYSGPGFHTGGNADSLFAARRIAGADVSGEITQSRLNNGREKWLGWAQVAARPNDDSNIELRYERSWVDSAASLTDGITYSIVTAAGDYQLTERLNLAGVIGRLDFSDGNDRALYRIKSSFLLSEKYGLSAYVRGRRYTNSEPYGGFYFAPERFHDYLGGIGVRRRLPLVRGTLSAQIDWGRQVVDGEESPAHTWYVRLESWVNSRWSYALAAGYNGIAGVGGGDNYEYKYMSASMTLAF